jgi:polysaccharide biosynthesis protein PslG
MTSKRRITLAISLAISALAVSAAPATAAKIDYGIAPNTIPLTQNDHDMMRQGNVDFVRLPFDWPSIQGSRGDCTPTGGACDWSSIDAQVGAAANNGIRILPNINQSARFVNNNVFKPPTNDLAAWRDFIQAAAQRYGPGGAFWQGYGGTPIPITTFQIWNEPGSNGDFEPKPNPKKYAKILKAAADAIYGVSKKLDVWVGGLFPDTGPKGITLEKFLAKLYKVKKIERSFDAVSIHPYSPKPGSGVASQVMRGRKAMNKAGDKKADIAVTELGYASGCSRCKKNNPPPVVVKNEKKQASALKSSFRSLKKKSGKLNLTSIIWFTWRDGVGPCDFCFTSGLLKENGSPKPAYNAFKKAAG